MTRKLRIGYGRICQETNAFSPVTSELEDFRRLHLMEGAELEAATSRRGSEVPDMIRNAELSGFRRAVRKLGQGRIEAVPLFSAWAVPAGPLSVACFEQLRDRLLASLRAAGPLDGVFLALHGALRGVAEIPEPEELLLAAVREVVGDEIPITVSMDLHGLLTPGKVEPLTSLAAYKTNPHRDLAQTGFRAGGILVRTALGQIRPTRAWRSLPMLLGGGLTIDFLGTMRPIFRRMRRMEREDPRVLDVSLFMCHVFNDSADLGWSVHVTTDGAPELAERIADEVAEMVWAVRNEPPPAFLPAEAGIEAVRKARLARRLGTVCVTDTSDVVGAGGTGENTRLLAALLEHARDLKSYVPVRDAVAVDQLWEQPLGSQVALEVGGRLDPVLCPAVAVSGTLRAKKDTGAFGRAVTLDLGHVQLILSEQAPLPIKPRFYREMGLEPWRADLVVVKNFFHYRLYYMGVHRKTVPIQTRGITDFEMVLEQQEFNDPVHPRDPVSDWRPADARRRGLVHS